MCASRCCGIGILQDLVCCPQVNKTHTKKKKPTLGDFDCTRMWRQWPHLLTYKWDTGSQQQDSDKQVLKLLSNQLPDALPWRRQRTINQSAGQALHRAAMWPTGPQRRNMYYKSQSLGLCTESMCRQGVMRMYRYIIRRPSDNMLFNEMLMQRCRW